jgi:ABC-2 type transport system ATP-binding protein
LDEPTSGVDPIARGAFWDLIREMARTGHTIFVSTHYMDEAEYCHRLALMYRGRVIALGAPEDLRAGLSAHTLLQLETSAPLDTMRTLERIPGIGDIAVFGGGLHVSVNSLEPAVEAIRIHLAAKGIEIRRLERIPPSLEDVFVALIEAEEKKIA